MALQPIIDGLGIPSLPTITFNGACLQQARANLPPTPLWQNGLDERKARQVVTLLSEQFGLGLSYSTRTSALFLARTPEQRELLSRYETLEGVPQDRVVQDSEELFAPGVSLPLKILALTRTPDEIAKKVRAAVAGCGIHVISAEMHVECVNEGVNKAAALRKLTDILGVPMSEVVAFGDAMNDIE